MSKIILPRYSAFKTKEEANDLRDRIEMDFHKLKLWEYPEIWNTKLIDHDDPEVWRVWSQWGDIRVFRHFSHPSLKKTFLHFHAAGSSIKVYGEYEHTFGIYGTEADDEKVLSATSDIVEELVSKIELKTVVQKFGSSYTFISPRCAHRINPKVPVESIMIMNPLFRAGLTKNLSRKSHPHKDLFDHQKDLLMKQMKERYEDTASFNFNYS